MVRLYDNAGGHTEVGHAAASESERVLRPLVKNLLDAGLDRRDVENMLIHTVTWQVTFQHLMRQMK